MQLNLLYLLNLLIGTCFIGCCVHPSDVPLGAKIKTWIFLKVNGGNQNKSSASSGLSWVPCDVCVGNVPLSLNVQELTKVEKIGRGRQPPPKCRASHQVMVKDVSASSVLHFWSSFSVCCLFVFTQSAQYVKPTRCLVYGHMCTAVPRGLPPSEP